MGVSWTNPWALALLAFASVLAVLFVRAGRKRQRGLLLFGVAWSGHVPRRYGGQALGLAGMTLVAIGVAAPRWGEPTSEDTKTGSDIIVVLDLSRSMLAEQPSRAEVARRMMRELGEAVKQRGGHRLGLIVFAAKCKLVVPLTRDYDHFLETMSRFDPAHPPRALIPAKDTKATSGTRIGTALRLAVDAHNEDMHHGQHIVLVSDGDDPANDEDWIDGADAARQRGIPVHTLGIGGPNANARIPITSGTLDETRDGWLWFGEDYVRSSLNEAVLRDISRRSGGEYLPVSVTTIPMLRRVLERTSAATEPEGDATVVPSRHVWFFAAGLLCWSLALVLEKLQAPMPARGISLRFASVSLFVVALLLISGEPHARDFIRRGNQAFATGKYEDALQHFERAEAHTSDPGLVAFNKAAVLYRLGRFREAQLHYQRCLEDDQIPTLRKAQAFYNLGNCLVRQVEAKDRRLLGEAIRAYELSLAEETDDSLRSDAKHNLEIARLLWQAAPPQTDDPNHAKAGDPSHKQQTHIKDGQANGKSGKLVDGPGGEANGKRAQGVGKESIPGGGTSPSLPDSDQPTRLSSDDILKLLADAARRIEADQRNAERRPGRAGSVLKDW